MARPAILRSRGVFQGTAVGLLFVLGTSAASAQRADTVVVRAGTPVHPGVSTLVEELTLGNGSRAPEYQFTHAFVTSGRDGSVFVIDIADPQNVGDFRPTVRRYDRTGKLVTTFGRAGQGPGEFSRGIGDVEELPDGRVLLTDHLGILVYSATGEPLGRWPTKASAANIGPPLLVDPSGFVYTYGARSPGGGPIRPGEDPVPILIRFRFDGTLIDSILAPEAAFANPPRIGRTRMPFTPRNLAAWSPLGYFVTGWSATYAVDLRLPSVQTHTGRPPEWSPTTGAVRSIRRTVQPIPVQDAERRDWTQAITMYNRSPAPRNAAWEWSGPDIPAVKPPLAGLHVDTRGRIWVRLSQPALMDMSVEVPARPATGNESFALEAVKRWAEPPVFDVFEPTGRYVGQVRFPVELRESVTRSWPGAPARVLTQSGLSIDGDIIWAVVHDDDDVPTVTRYRIQWGR